MLFTLIPLALILYFSRWQIKNEWREKHYNFIKRNYDIIDNE